MITFSRWLTAVLVLFAFSYTADPTVQSLFPEDDNLDFTSAANGKIVARFVVINSSLTDFTIYISFSNSCNVAHFTTGNSVPLQKVRITIDETTEEELWDRTTDGGDCSAVMSWSPAGPGFNETYMIDILFDWNASPQSVTLAGSYSETLSFVAIEN